jgi:hypothetical protein
VVAILMFGLAVGYALTYSGMSELSGDPISTVGALFGPKHDPKRAGASSTARPSARRKVTA